MSYAPDKVVVLNAVDFVLAGDVAQTILTGIANRQKDRADEALDAKRVHGGQTLDEFLGAQ